MKDNNVNGVDISKNVFEVCVQDSSGRVTMTRRLSRLNVLRGFARQPSARVGLEACGGAHYWAREIHARGLTKT